MSAIKQLFGKYDVWIPTVSLTVTMILSLMFWLLV